MQCAWCLYLFLLDLFKGLLNVKEIVDILQYQLYKLYNI